MAMLAAANMDPDANPHPEKLDLERRPNRHLSFGTGIHFCLGHQLARIEGKCALEALFKRWPQLELAVPGLHPLAAAAWPPGHRKASCRDPLPITCFFSSGRFGHVSGSTADMQCKRHVRFTPKADMCSAPAHVRFGPIADTSPVQSLCPLSPTGRHA